MTDTPIAERIRNMRTWIDADDESNRPTTRWFRALADEVGALERKFDEAMSIVANSVSDETVEKIEQIHLATIAKLEEQHKADVASRVSVPDMVVRLTAAKIERDGYRRLVVRLVRGTPEGHCLDAGAYIRAERILALEATDE